MKGRVATLYAFRERLESLRDQADVAAERQDFDATDPHVQRAVAVEALAAVCELIDDIGWEGQKLSGPFVRLCIALSDIDLGRKDEIFTPTSLGHRPPTSYAMLNFRGRVSAVMDKLMECGFSEESAAETVFQALGPGYTETLRGTSRSDPSWKNIKRWRNETLYSDQDSPEKSGFSAMRQIILDRRMMISEAAAEADARRLLSALKKEIRDPFLIARNPEKGGS